MLRLCEGGAWCSRAPAMFQNAPLYAGAPIPFKRVPRKDGADTVPVSPPEAATQPGQRPEPEGPECGLRERVAEQVTEAPRPGREAGARPGKPPVLPQPVYPRRREHTALPSPAPGARVRQLWDEGRENGWTPDPKSCSWNLRIHRPHQLSRRPRVSSIQNVGHSPKSSGTPRPGIPQLDRHPR